MSGKSDETGMSWQVRWLMAAIATLVTTGIGLINLANADEPCGLKEAMAFQAEITNPQEEADPAYYLSKAEAFIAACPDRFEVRDAHLVAARGALDSGDGKRAARHYDAAIERGVRLTPQQTMDYAIALRAIGATGKAKALQASTLMAWAAQVTEAGLGSIEMRDTEDGQVFSALFDAVDPDLQISAMWLAMPRGDGLPAAIVIRPAFKRAAWRAVREGGPPKALMVAELHQCRDRAVVKEVVGVMRAEDAEDVAMETLFDYMDAPDRLAKTPAGQPLAACLTLDHMLHVPDPMTAIPVGN